MRNLIWLVTLGFVVACASGEGPSEATSTQTATAPAAGGSLATAPTDAGPRAAYAGIFAGDAKLTPVDVATWSEAERRLKRNEVFAKHGRAFKSDDLQKHFGAQPWYAVDAAYSDARLSAADKANIDLIKSFDGTHDLVKLGQLDNHVSGPEVMITDSKTLRVLNGGGMYEHLDDVRHYASRGEWVLTWTGAATWNPEDPEVKAPQLWKVNRTEKTITAIHEIPRG